MNVGFITRPQTAGIHVDDGGSLSDWTTMYHGLVTYSNSRWMMQNLEGKTRQANPNGNRSERLVLPLYQRRIPNMQLD